MTIERSSSNSFAEYFRCPDQFAQLRPAADLSAGEGYFRWQGAVCYGACSGTTPSRDVREATGVERLSLEEGGPVLPFNLDAVVSNLREERYHQAAPHPLERLTAGDLTRSLYYAVRPILPVWFRRHLQRARLAGWRRIPFPAWPVDVTVEILMKQAMRLVVEQSDVERVPFVWFWPDGAAAAAMVTHDVEDRSGWDFCDRVMDIDSAFGITSAFQLVPELPRGAPEQLFEDIRSRGFEVNLHDVNHDGYLFHTRGHFQQRVSRLNDYGRRFGCRGFRSGAMYRQQHWYDELEFAYDMSVPNVAHLEPQRGGCCTVMPYFVGGLLELPLTTTQDYSLLHILDDYSTAVWKDQIRMIRDHSGLVSILTHPDYLAEPRALNVYRELLDYLASLRSSGQLWVAPPAAVNDWWRARRNMQVVEDGGRWRVVGPGSTRARVAFAYVQADSVRFEVSDALARDPRGGEPMPRR